MFEAGARRDRLERLDEAAVLREGQIFLDRPRPRLGGESVALSLLLPEAERGAEHRIRCLGTVEHDETGGFALRDGRHRVGGAEIEAEREGRSD